MSPARSDSFVLVALLFRRNALLLLEITALLDRLFLAVPRAMPDIIALVAQLTKRLALLRPGAIVQQGLRLLLGYLVLWDHTVWEDLLWPHHVRTRRPVTTVLLVRLLRRVLKPRLDSILPVEWQTRQLVHAILGRSALQALRLQWGCHVLLASSALVAVHFHRTVLHHLAISAPLRLRSLKGRPVKLANIALVVLQIWRHAQLPQAIIVLLDLLILLEAHAMLDTFVLAVELCLRLVKHRLATTARLVHQSLLASRYQRATSRQRTWVTKLHALARREITVQKVHQWLLGSPAPSDTSAQAAVRYPKSVLLQLEVSALPDPAEPRELHAWPAIIV